MNPTVLRLATRASALARWQAEHVATLLRLQLPEVTIELVPVTTHADRHLELPIAEIGGKGVFVKEVQHAVLQGRADLAVHSAKDLPAVTVDGLVLAAVPERGDPRDALAGASLDDLASGSVVGTGSARRRVQLAARRADLEIVGLRGNIETRLRRIDDGGMDAIMVAAVALERLDLTGRAAQTFGVDDFVPQVGQGALAVECRHDDDATRTVLRGIEHAESRLCVEAERAFLHRLGGDCDLPVGAHATVDGHGVLRITGLLAPSVDALPEQVTLEGRADLAGAHRVGRDLADALVGRGDGT